MGCNAFISPVSSSMVARAARQVASAFGFISADELQISSESTEAHLDIHGV
ncbi:hypothetical protein M405DRAFT_824755, partial [Rhizopogon salebrosus TDB-379]